MIRKVVGAALALGLATALIGCGQTQTNNVGGQQRPVNVQRVVSLSPNLTEIIGTTARQMLVGKTMACNYPAGLTVDNVVAGSEINYELVAQADPDLIVYDSDLFSETDIQKLQDLGAEVRGYAPKTVDEYVEMVVEIAQLTGTETMNSKNLDDLSSALEVARGSIPAETVSTVVLMGGGATEYMAAGTGTLLADLMRQSNLVFNGPDSPQFAPINAEQLIAWNPDMILATPESAEQIIKDPRLSTLDAVKNQRVFGINADILLRSGDRLDTLVSAVEQQAQRIVIAKKG